VDATADDVFVAFSFTPFSRTTDQLARRAVAAGAKLIAVSDSVGSPLRKLADPLLFIAPSLSRAFPETAGGASALANLLAALTVAQLGEKGQKRIKANEEYLTRSGEYIGTGRPSARKPPK
jgi:DNA-binding MurR/RpiR family transcriptional regulator